MRAKSYKPLLTCAGIAVLALLVAGTALWFALNRSQKPPDALAELTALPVYPTARDVQVLQRGSTQDPAVMTYQTSDMPDAVLDFYRQELESSGWFYFERGTRAAPRVDWYGKSDTIFAGYEFRNIESQGWGLPLITPREHRVESVLEVEAYTAYINGAETSSVRLQMEVTNLR